MIMADGNRFKSLATKTTQYEDDGKICIEQIVAEALANMGATEQPKTKAKRATKDSKVNNCVDGAAIGDIIAQVIAAIQPVFVKSITVAVTTAVKAATAQIMANVRREMGVIEDVGKKLCSLQVENQKLTFEVDRLEQYSRRENVPRVRIYGLAETQGESTNTVFIDMARDICVTITPADISVSHRLGRPGRGGSTADSRPRPLIVKLVRRDTKFELMRNKKKMRAMEKYRHVYVNDDLTTPRSKLVKILKGEKEIKSVWTIEGRINCTFDRDGHEVRKVIESPDDLFKLGWTEAKIAGLGLYTDV